MAPDQALVTPPELRDLVEDDPPAIETDSLAITIVDHVLAKTRQVKQPYDALMYLEGELRVCLRTGRQFERAVWMLVAHIRDKKLFRSTHKTFQEWLGDFLPSVGISERSAWEALQQVRVGLHPKGLGLTPEEFLEIPAGTLQSLVRSSAYDARTGEILDDEDPELPDNKYGRGRAREALDAAKVLPVSEARALFESETGRERPRWTCDLTLVSPTEIRVDRIRAILPTGELRELDSLTPDLARNLLRRLGEDYDRLVGRVS